MLDRSKNPKVKVTEDNIEIVGKGSVLVTEENYIRIREMFPDLRIGIGDTITFTDYSKNES